MLFGVEGTDMRPLYFFLVLCSDAAEERQVGTSTDACSRAEEGTKDRERSYRSELEREGQAEGQFWSRP